MSQIKSLSEILPDLRNLNRGTERGSRLLEDSERKFGMGRPILLDKNARIIAGNHVAEAAASIGIDKIRIIPSNGKKLVVVRRTDLDMMENPEARALAIYDNRVGQLNLDWNPDEFLVLRTGQFDFDPWFTDEEIEKIIEGVDEPPPDNHDLVVLSFDRSEAKEFHRIITVLGGRYLTSSPSQTLYRAVMEMDDIVRAR